MNTRPLTTNEVADQVYDFINSHNGNFDLVNIHLPQKQEDIYGKDAAIDTLGYPILGAYHPSSRSLTIPTDNHTLNNIEDLKLTIKHELLGHYAINTLSKEEKLNLLDNIIISKHDESMKQTWDYVDKNYPHMTLHHRAEEVYAFTAETLSTNELDLNTPVNSNYLLSSGNHLNIDDLKGLATKISREIKQGVRSLQIVPNTDQEQFRKSSLSLVEQHQISEHNKPAQMLALTLSKETNNYDNSTLDQLSYWRTIATLQADTPSQIKQIESNFDNQAKHPNFINQLSNELSSEVQPLSPDFSYSEQELSL